MPRRSSRPAVPAVSGLDALTGTPNSGAASVVPQPEPETEAPAAAPEPTPAAEQAPVPATASAHSPTPRPRARVTDPDEIQPRRRENRAADLAVKVFVYFSEEDEATLEALTEKWQCSRSEVLRVLVRRARAQHLRD